MAMNPVEFGFEFGDEVLDIIGARMDDELKLFVSWLVYSFYQEDSLTTYTGIDNQTPQCRSYPRA